MNKPKIDLPTYATFTVVCDGKDTAVVVIPRPGCESCFLRHRQLCNDMCCCEDERRDGQGVQFVKIETTVSPVIFNTEIDLRVTHGTSKEKETANSENN